MTKKLGRCELFDLLEPKIAKLAKGLPEELVQQEFLDAYRLYEVNSDPDFNAEAYFMADFKDMATCWRLSRTQRGYVQGYDWEWEDTFSELWSWVKQEVKTNENLGFDREGYITNFAKNKLAEIQRNRLPGKSANNPKNDVALLKRVASSAVKRIDGNKFYDPGVQTTESFDPELHPCGGLESHDPDNPDNDPERVKRRRDFARRLLKILNPRDRALVEYKFGMGKDRLEWTVKDLAVYFYMSSGNASRIINKSLKLMNEGEEYPMFFL